MFKNLLFVSVITFFTIVFWYYGLNNFAEKSKKRMDSVIRKKIESGMKWVEDKKNFVTITLIGIITGLIPQYINDPSMSAPLWFFLFGSLFLQVKFHLENNPKTEFFSGVTISAVLFATNEELRNFDSVGWMLLITAIRVGFVVLYRQLKKAFKEYTDLILSIIWTGYLMLWIGRFFNISYVYFLISVLVLSTLNNTVMGAFRNNPIKENVVFLMGEIEIILIPIIVVYEVVFCSKDVTFWAYVYTGIGYTLFLIETVYAIFLEKK